MQILILNDYTLLIVKFDLTILLHWAVWAFENISYKKVCYLPGPYSVNTLQWRHNRRDGVSNHRHPKCLVNRLFRRRSKKTSKLRAARLCEGNSPLTDEFPAQRDSKYENVSICWRHHNLKAMHLLLIGLGHHCFLPVPRSYWIHWPLGDLVVIITCVFFKQILLGKFMILSSWVALRWVPQNTFGDTSSLVKNIYHRKVETRRWIKLNFLLRF